MIKFHFTPSWKTALYAAMALFAMGTVNGAHGQAAPPSAPAAAGDFEARHASDLAKNPEGVSCILRTRGGQTRFHMGEIIPLEAVFSAVDPKRYRLNIDAANRGLIWSSDSIVVDREEDAPDSLNSFYDSSRGFVYSGPGPQFRDLDTSTPPISLDANEWRRFDKPGVYRIYLRTMRLQMRSPKQENILSLGPLQMASGILQIEILPFDPIWSQQTLSKALPAFQANANHNIYSDAGLAAARIVRFLDTPKSQAALIERYATLTLMDSWNSALYWNVTMGLYGSRHPKNAIARMQSKIADPRFPVASFFLTDLAHLQVMDAFPALSSRPVGDPTKIAAWEKELSARIAAEAKFAADDQELLRRALPSKIGSAHAQSAFGLFDAATRSSATNPRLAKRTAPLVAAEFGALTPDEQSSLFQDYSWPYLRGPKMLRALRSVYQTPQGKSEYEVRDLRTMALRRLREISPAEGRGLILTELQSPSPRISMELLTSLPDATLPSIDLTLAANLLKSGDTDMIAPLIARYATTAILQQVKAFYGDKGGEWACAIQSALLAYFLRVDPDYGVVQAKKALAARKDTGCYRTLFSDVAQYRRPDAWSMPPVLQRIALSALSDLDVDVAADAAKALGAHGSPAAEAPLWAKLRRLHQRGGKSTDYRSLQIVADALAMSPAWLIDHRQFEAIRSFFPKADPANQFWAYSVDRGNQICLYGDIVHEDGLNESWRVGQYTLSSRADLRRKLTQYPKGTTITLVSSGGADGSPERQKAFMEVRAVLAIHGMRLKQGK